MIGTVAELPVLTQGAVTVLPDGTRVHDQSVVCGAATRWIAWREVAVRGDAGTEMQGVGRDVSYRVEAEHALAPGARPGGNRQPRQVALPRHGQP